MKYSFSSFDFDNYYFIAATRTLNEQWVILAEEELSFIDIDPEINTDGVACDVDKHRFS
jgi:hypothetical protein